jgi:5'-nucleotidase (lipoprotein e(P4) family)
MTRATGRAAAAAVMAALVGVGGRAEAPGARRDTHENLHAVLWMQTAAEYQAITRGIYHLGALQLDRALDDKRWTAIPDQAGRADLPALGPAVILDVDETVLDNSPEEGERVRGRAGYVPELFRTWVARAEAASVPGATDFVRYAMSRGVEVFLVTNRDPTMKDATVENLRKRGVNINAGQILCFGEHGREDDPSDKSGRRQFVAATHRVLLLVGDDLGDFVSVTEPPARRFGRAERALLVERFSGYWEERWFVLPNPAYGSWEKTFYSAAAADADALARQFEGVRGFKQRP